MSAAARVVIKPHIPLIKFRKGSLFPLERLVAAPEPALDAHPPQGTTAGASSAVSLEWWDLPLKFRRAGIDDLECESINSGGADKSWN